MESRGPLWTYAMSGIYTLRVTVAYWGPTVQVQAKHYSTSIEQS